MKTVCKKLLSLMLVAVLLVSAVPMMASAAESKEVYVTIKEGTLDKSEDTGVTFTVSVEPGVDTVNQVVAKGTPGYDVTTELVGAKVKHEPENGNVTVIGLGEALPEDVRGIYLIYAPKTAAGSQDQGDQTTTDEGSQTSDGDTQGENQDVQTPSVAPISITVKVDNSDNVVWTGSKVPANGKSSLVKDLLSYVWNSDWDNAYTFHHAWVSERQTDLGQNDKVYAGETLYIALENKTTSGNGSGSGSGSGSDSGSSSKFPYSVYLHIYAKGNVATPIKTVTLDTWTCVKDGVINLEELKEVVKTYYTAKTSDGIGYDGIYYSTSTTKNDYVNDTNHTKEITNLDTLRTQGYVHLNVWINNYVAKSSSSSNADTSNPKTGDSIYTAVAVMGLSVTALAAVYFINKKRIAY